MFGSLAKGTTKITIFWKEQTAFPPSPVSAKWALILRITMEKFWSMEKDFTDYLSLLIFWMLETAAQLPARFPVFLQDRIFVSELTGDDSIQSRPMKRIMTPLLSMGADITSIKGNNCVPLRITGHPLKGHSL